MSKLFRISSLIFLSTIVISLLLVGRTAVNRYYDYQTMVAPRSLHQMTLEYLDDGDSRESTMAYGAGLLAIGVLTFGGFMMAMNNGGEFFRQLRLFRRNSAASRPRVASPSAPTIHSAQHAPLLSEVNSEHVDNL